MNYICTNVFHQIMLFMHLFKDNIQLACPQKQLSQRLPAHSWHLQSPQWREPSVAAGRSNTSPAQRAPSPAAAKAGLLGAYPSWRAGGQMERAALLQGSTHRPSGCWHPWVYGETSSFLTILQCRAYNVKTFLYSV